MAGSLLAAVLYKLIKALEYESANPIQSLDQYIKHQRIRCNWMDGTYRRQQIDERVKMEC